MGGAVGVVLPRQLTHHLQQGLVLLLQLLVLVLNVIQVLPRQRGGETSEGEYSATRGGGGAEGSLAPRSQAATN